MTTPPTKSAAKLLAHNLGRLIDAVREAEPSLTREQLAERLVPGVEPASALSILKGYRAAKRWPRSGRLDDIARGLGVDVAELFRP